MLETVKFQSVECPDKVIVWLHGFGADANDSFHIVSQLAQIGEQKTKFILPSAPYRGVTFLNGQLARAWFDIKSLEEMSWDDEVMKQIELLNDDLHDVIKQQMDEGFNNKAIYLAGFSQGGMMALYSALTFTEPLAGVIGLSTAFPESCLDSVGGDASGMPVFLAHGLKDEVIHFEEAVQLSKNLSARGFPVSYQQYDMAHNVCEQEIVDICDWLANVSQINNALPFTQQTKLGGCHAS